MATHLTSSKADKLAKADERQAGELFDFWSVDDFG
jgi:hypothetical protein